MKIVTWNVNGLRRNQGVVRELFNTHDIVCLQETRCDEVQLILETNAPDFEHFTNPGKRKGYSGVSISIKKGVGHIKDVITPNFHDTVLSEGRAILVTLDNTSIMSVYSPNSGRKLVRLDLRTKEFDPNLRDWISSNVTGPLVLVGDLNVAPKNIDIYKPDKAHEKLAGFVPVERENFRTLLRDTGLVDMYRAIHPHKQAYTYWSNFANSRAENKGWRIDHVLVRGCGTGTCDILTSFMGSDHAPVSATIQIPNVHATSSKSNQTSSKPTASITKKSDILHNVRVRLLAHQLLELEKIPTKPTARFGAMAYEKVLRELDQHSSLPEYIPGVGEKIASVIQLAMKNKSDPELTRPLLTKARNILSLTALPGIGPKRAMELVAHKDWRKQLTSAQLLALNNLDDIKSKIPRTEMLEHEKYILSHAAAKTMLAGSFRRGAESSGDIDVLTLDTNLVQRLGDYIVGTLADGPRKFMGLCRMGHDGLLRRIDIVYTTPEQWGLASVYFTGSKEFNIHMRKHAHELGYSLSENELSGSNIRTFYEESDVFKALNIKYVNPIHRNNDLVR